MIDIKFMEVQIAVGKYAFAQNLLTAYKISDQEYYPLS